MQNRSANNAAVAAAMQRRRAADNISASQPSSAPQYFSPTSMEGESEFDYSDQRQLPPLQIRRAGAALPIASMTPQEQAAAEAAQWAAYQAQQQEDVPTSDNAAWDEVESHLHPNIDIPEEDAFEQAMTESRLPASEHRPAVSNVTDVDTDELFAHFNRSHSLPIAGPVQPVPPSVLPQLSQPGSTEQIRQQSVSMRRSPLRQHADRIEEEEEIDEEEGAEESRRQRSIQSAVNRHPMEVVYPEDEDAIDDTEEEDGLVRAHPEEQREQMPQSQIQQHRPVTQRSQSMPMYQQYQRQQLYEQQRAQLLQQQEEQRQILFQQQQVQQRRQQEMLDGTDASDGGRLPKAQLLAQRHQLRQQHLIQQRSMRESDFEEEFRQRSDAMAVNAHAAAASSYAQPASNSFGSFDHSQSRLGASALRSLDSPLPGQGRLDEIARRLQIMEERKAAAAAQQLNMSNMSSVSGAAATTLQDPTTSQLSASGGDWGGQNSTYSNASSTAPAGEILKNDLRGNLYDALRKIQRMRGARGQSALLSHSQLASSAGKAAITSSLNGSQSILSHSLSPSFAASANSSSAPFTLHHLLRQHVATNSHLASSRAGRWRSPLVAPDEVPSFLGASQARSAAQLRAQEQHPQASMHDLSLSAILAQSTAGPRAGATGVAGAVSEPDEIPPMVAAALAESNSTRKRLEELQLQQISLNQSQQALEASLRHMAASTGAQMGSSAFLQPDTLPASAPRSRNSIAADTAGPSRVEPNSPPQGPSFFLYSESEEEAHLERMQAAQDTMQKQQLQRSALIAQQDAVLQQQQQLLLQNASQLVHSMSAAAGLQSTLTGGAPSHSPHMIHSSPQPLNMAKPYPNSPGSSPSARALQQQLDSTARVWDEVDEVLMAPTAAVAARPALSHDNRNASGHTGNTSTTHVVRPGAGGSTEPIVSVQTGQGHSITVNVHPVINVMTDGSNARPAQPRSDSSLAHTPPLDAITDRDELERHRSVFMRKVIEPANYHTTAGSPDVHPIRSAAFNAASELAKYNHSIASTHQQSSMGLDAAVAAQLAQTEFNVDDTQPAGAHYLDHLVNQKAALFAHLQGLEVTEAAERQKERAVFEKGLRRIEEQAHENKQETERGRRKTQRMELYASLQQTHHEQEQQLHRQSRSLAKEFGEEKQQLFTPSPAQQTMHSPYIQQIQQRSHLHHNPPRTFTFSPHAAPVMSPDTSMRGTNTFTQSLPHKSPVSANSHPPMYSPSADALAAAEESAARSRASAAKERIASLEALDESRRMEAARIRADEDAEFEEEMRRERSRAHMKWEEQQHASETHARAVIAAQVREETAAREKALKQQKEQLEAKEKARELQRQREDLADSERQRTLKEREEYLNKLRREREEFIEQERLAKERELRQREESLQSMRAERIDAEIAMQREVEARVKRDQEEQDRLRLAQREAELTRQEHQEAMARAEQRHSRALDAVALSQADANSDIAAGFDQSHNTERILYPSQQILMDTSREQQISSQVTSQSSQPQTERTDVGANTQRSMSGAGENDFSSRALAAAMADEPSPPDSPKKLTARAQTAPRRSSVIVQQPFLQIQQPAHVEEEDEFPDESLRWDTPPPLDADDFAPSAKQQQTLAIAPSSSTHVTPQHSAIAPLPETPVYRNDPTSAAPGSLAFSAHRPPALQTGPLRTANMAVAQPSASPPLLSPNELEDDLLADLRESDAIKAAIASPPKPATMLSPSLAQQLADQASMGADASLLDESELNDSVDSLGFPKVGARVDRSFDSVSRSGAPSTKVGSGHTRGGTKRGGSVAGEDSYGGSSGNFDWLNTDADLTFDKPAGSPSAVTDDWRQSRADKWNVKLTSGPTTTQLDAVAQNTTPAPPNRIQPRTISANGQSSAAIPSFGYGEEDLQSDLADADFDTAYQAEGDVTRPNIIPAQPAGSKEPDMDFLDDADFDRIAAEAEDADWLP
jgi:hypothetical protein